MSSRRRVRDVMWAVGLVVVVVLTRLPFRSQILYHWDSVNFANAMREFNVILEHPQPPGYIVYVWLCRAVDLLFHDAQTTMVWVSLSSSALAVAALYGLGQSMAGRRTGRAAALLLASSPLFWFYGEIALPHALDTLLVTLSVWWLFEVMQGNKSYVLPVIVTLAVAGGVRQQTLVFLMPLTLFAVRRVRPGRLLGAICVGATICLIWFIPLISSAGGLHPYWTKLASFGAHYQRKTSIIQGAGWEGVAYNLRRLVMYTSYGLAGALIPLPVFAGLRLRHPLAPRPWARWTFLSLWIGPVLAFYSFIHMGQQGLIFVFLPAFLLVSAVALARLLDWLNLSQWFGAAIATLTLVNASLFCVLPEYPLGPGTQRLLTRATLINSDRYFADRFTAVRASFAPQNTLILSLEPEHIAYYLPEYGRLRFPPGNAEPQPAANQHQATRGVRGQWIVSLDTPAVVVIFDPALEGFNQSPTRVRRLSLESGGEMSYLELGDEETFFLGPQEFGTHDT